MFSWNTLKIRNPRQFFWNLFILIISFMMIEASTRVFDLLSILSYPPSLGSGNLDFDLKVKYLDQYVNKNGNIDCIIIGSSLVDYGIDPEALASRYLQITGEELQCFNFGIRGSKANELEMMMEFIIARYHPDVIIYATWPRDYIFLASSINRSAWIDYQIGTRSVRGWLANNLETLQFAHTVLNMIWYNDVKDKALLTDTAENGYFEQYETFSPEPSPPDKAVYQPYEENFELLKNVVNLTHENDVDLYIVAIPARIASGKYMPELYDQLGTDITEKTGEPYIDLDQELLSQLSPEDYSDQYHMNANNAIIYSSWLAEKIASLRSQ